MTRIRQDIEPQVVKQWKGANNLPGATSRKPGWKHPVMAHAKMIIWQAGLEQCGNNESALINTTDWSDRFGITGKFLLTEVRRHVPQFDEIYERQRGKRTDGEKASDLQNRHYYMYRQRPKKGAKKKEVFQRISSEHPMRSKRLGPLIPWAERVYHKKLVWYWRP